MGSSLRIPLAEASPAGGSLIDVLAARFVFGLSGWRGLIGTPENRQHAIQSNYEQFVVMFELDGDGLAGVEKHLVVLADGLIFVVFDLFADGDDSAGDDGDFVAVREDDAGAGFAAVFVLADDDAFADGLDDVVFGAALAGGFDCHDRGI